MLIILEQLRKQEPCDRVFKVVVLDRRHIDELQSGQARVGGGVAVVVTTIKDKGINAAAIVLRAHQMFASQDQDQGCCCLFWCRAR
jgi:hypothetical protein